MRRRRWFRLRLLALGLAVAACAAPAAQAMPASVDRGEPVVSPDDRRSHGTNPQVGTENGRVNPPAPQMSTTSDEGGFELSSGRLAGIGLALLAVVAAGYAALQAFKADKAAGI